MGAEAAPREYRQTHGSKIARSNRVVPGGNVEGGPRGHAFRPGGFVPSAQSESPLRKSCRLHARQRAQALFNLTIETTLVCFVRVACRMRVEVEKQHAFRVEARIHARQIHQTAEKQARAHKKDHPNRHLRNDQCSAQRSRHLRGDGAAAFLERRRQLDSSRAQRGEHTEQDRGEERHSHRECEHASVRRYVERNDIRSGRNHCQKEAIGPGRKKNSQHARQGGEQQAFEEELADQSRPPGAERQAHRKFPLPCGAAREQKVRDVRAGDQQHQGHNGHEHPERLLKLVTKKGNAIRRRQHLDVRLLDVLRVFLGGLGAGIIAENVFENHVDVRVRLRHAHAGLQPGDDIEGTVELVADFVRAPVDEVVHLKREPQIGRVADGSAEE